MLSVFQVFKIIFGVAASAVVLYFLITYAGAYGESQKDVQRSLVMGNLRQLASDVLVSGNGQAFDLSKVDKEIYYDTKQAIPVFRFGNNFMEMTAPLLFRQGDSIALTRSSLDFGWWKFSMAEATPAMDVIFNPLDNSQSSWDLMKNITAALPDTSALGAKFRYAFCGYPSPGELAPAQPVEKFEFQRLLTLNRNIAFRPCSASLGANQLLVAVSSACSSPASGICASPSGFFFIAGSDDARQFMDGMDIAAAIIGGTEKGINGIAGENLYMYKQKVFREQAKLAADIMAARASMLSSKFTELLVSGIIEQGSGPAACAVYYNDLSSELSAFSSELSNADYYENSARLASGLYASSATYAMLSKRGCEVAG